MELSYPEKQALLARLAGRRHPPYDPATDISLADMLAQLAQTQPNPSRNVAERILKDAVAAGELVKGQATHRGKVIVVYRRPADA